MSDLRDQIRATISNSPKAKPATEVIDFFDTKIELRQASLGQIISNTSDEGDSEEQQRSKAVKGLIDGAYVPGTEEKVFDIGDTEWLQSLPYNADLAKAFNTLTKLSVPPTTEPAGS
jgi:hypothetical protein